MLFAGARLHTARVGCAVSVAVSRRMLHVWSQSVSFCAYLVCGLDRVVLRDVRIPYPESAHAPPTAAHTDTLTHHTTERERPKRQRATAQAQLPRVLQRPAHTGAQRPRQGPGPGRRTVLLDVCVV